MKGRRKGSAMTFLNHTGSIVFIESDFLSAKVFYCNETEKTQTFELYHHRKATGMDG